MRDFVIGISEYAKGQQADYDGVYLDIIDAFEYFEQGRANLF